MKRKNLSWIGTGWLCVPLLFAGAASAQQKAQTVPQRNQAYEISRETVLQGTVVKYTEASSVAPLGAHVTVQTASGAVDVHIGNAKLLDSSHFTLAAGDSIKVVGENLPYGNGIQFFARLLEKGNQAIAVRGIRGFPMRSVSTNTNAAKSEGGAL
jgi:hypothetical protein